MPGPLPKAADQRRRRNQPTIPTTKLPAAGRKGRPPKAPYELGGRGKAWWTWAWGLPQACAWSSGDLYALARRAQLEDDVAALAGVESVILPIAELTAGGDDELAGVLRAVDAIMARLKALAGSKTTLLREMRELDDRLGLTPKGLAALRWEIVEPEAAKPAEPTGGPPVRRLRAVESA